mgnify:CR=1 FL=1
MGTLLADLLESYTSIRKREWSPMLFEANPNQLYGLPKPEKGGVPMSVDDYRAKLTTLKSAIQGLLNSGQAGGMPIAMTAQDAIQKVSALPKFSVIAYGSPPTGAVIGGQGAHSNFSINGALMKQPSIIDGFLQRDIKEPQGPKDGEGKDKDINAPDAEAVPEAPPLTFDDPEVVKDLDRAWELDEKGSGSLGKQHEHNFEEWLEAVEKSINDVDKQKVCEKMLEFANIKSDGAKSGKSDKEIAFEQAEYCQNVNDQAKLEMKAAVGHLASIRGKVKATGEGKDRRYFLDETSLSTEEKGVLACLTVRGANQDKRIHIGHKECESLGLEQLQEMSSQGGGAYGTTLMNWKGEDKLAPLARILGKTKILPEGMSSEDLSPKDYNDLEDCCRKSTSAKNANGGIISDERGKMFEAAHLLSLAALSGSDKDRKLAVTEMVKQIERVCGVGALNEASAMVGSKASDIIDALGSIGGEDCKTGVQKEMTAMIKASAITNAAIGLTPELIDRIEHPAQQTKPGHRADVVVHLKPGVEIPKQMEEYVTCDSSKGSTPKCRLEFSNKFYSEGAKSLSAGATSVKKTFDPEFEGYADVAELREQQYEDQGLSPDQIELCKEAQETDEKLYLETRDKWAHLDKSNSRTTLTYIKEFKKDGCSSPGDGGKCNKKQTAEFNRQMQDMMNVLDPKHKDYAPERFALKMFQFERMREAERNPGYAKGVAFNAIAVTMGSAGNEIITAGNDSSVYIARVSDLMAVNTDAIFNGGKVKMRLGGVSIFDKEGDKVGGADTRKKKTATGYKENQEGEFTTACQRKATAKRIKYPR